MNRQEIIEVSRKGLERSLLPSIRNFKLGRLSQQEERTMNDNLNTPEGDNTNTDKTWRPRLTDEDFAKLLETKSLDGETLSFINGEPIAYVTDADEATDEPTPTIH